MGMARMGMARPNSDALPGYAAHNRTRCQHQSGPLDIFPDAAACVGVAI